MKQASDIRKATDPDEVLFVIDAMIGQDAVNTAKAFQEGVDFTGVVLSKLDGDARGGAALSVASVTGRPIIFASTGEGLDDLEAFHPDRMASRILDLGDILTLIEQAQQAFDEEEAMKMAEKLATETFTLEDFLDQMQQMKKMGSMKKMLGMLPGMGQMKQQLEDFDEREIDRTEAIIRSMTPGERRNPKVLNGSRRLRIARGSGMTVTDVNAARQRFEQAAKMMKTVARGGVPNIPGMGPIPGGASRRVGQARQAGQGEGLALGQPRQARGRERRDRRGGSGRPDRLGLRPRRGPKGAPTRGGPRRAAEAARQGLSRGIRSPVGAASAAGRSAPIRASTVDLAYRSIRRSILAVARCPRLIARGSAPPQATVESASAPQTAARRRIGARPRGRRSRHGSRRTASRTGSDRAGGIAHPQIAGARRRVQRSRHRDPPSPPATSGACRAVWLVRTAATPTPRRGRSRRRPR